MTSSILVLGQGRPCPALLGSTCYEWISWPPQTRRGCLASTLLRAPQTHSGPTAILPLTFIAMFPTGRALYASATYLLMLVSARRRPPSLRLWYYLDWARLPLLGGDGVRTDAEASSKRERKVQPCLCKATSMARRRALVPPRWGLNSCFSQYPARWAGLTWCRPFGPKKLTPSRSPCSQPFHSPPIALKKLPTPTARPCCQHGV